MKLSTIFLVSLAVLVVAFLIWSAATYRGRHSAATGTAVYDVAKEVQVVGTVKDVRDFASPESGDVMGSHLRLQTAKGAVWVYVAPTSILHSWNLSFNPGDQIVVVGSEVQVSDRYDLIARQIRRSGKAVVLRDVQGKLITQQY